MDDEKQAPRQPLTGNESVTNLTVRMAVLEQQHLSFERSAMAFMRNATNEETGIQGRLDRLVEEVHRIPNGVAEQLNQCRADMRAEIAREYPKKHEIVTPKALMMAASLMAGVLVAGMTVTMVVWDKIDIHDDTLAYELIGSHDHAEPDNGDSKD